MLFLRWMRRSPRLMFTVATVAALWVVFVIAGRESERQWQAYCTAARLRGVKLTQAEFEQPAVDPAQNFAEIPLMQAALKGGGASSPFRLPNGLSRGNPLARGAKDWKACQTLFQASRLLTEVTDDPVRDVLRALDRYAPAIKEWEKGSQRPFCRFPSELSAGLVRPFNGIDIFLNAAGFFSLRMRAHLALNDSKAAYEDFHNGLQTYRALSEEASLLTGTVRIMVLVTLTEPLGEGLAQGAWAEPELSKIQAELAALEIVRDYRQAIAGERALANSLLELWITGPALQRANVLSDMPSSPATTIGYALMPQKLIRDNQLRINRYFDETLARISPDGTAINSMATMIPSSSTSLAAKLYFGLSMWFTRNVPSPETYVLQALATRNHAMVACALERFKLTRGHYPAALTELIPEFCEKLPPDVYSGAPLSYSQTPGGSFTLSSGGSPPTTKVNWSHAPPEAKQ